MNKQNLAWIIGMFFMALIAPAAHAQVGAVLDLDGTGDYVAVTDNAYLDITKNITLEAWVTYAALPSVGNVQSIIGKQNWVGETYAGYTLHTYNSGAAYSVYLTIDIQNTICSWTPVVGTWYHIVGIYNRTDQKGYIYLNGNLLCSNLMNQGDIGTSDVSLVIGKRDDGFNWNGKLDEVRIYNRTLSADEISNSYQRGLQHLASNNSNANLLGYWPFDGNALDYSAHGNNGTFNGNARTASFIIGNSSNVTTSGITGLNITLAGSTLLNETYTGTKALEIKDGSDLIFNLSHNFSKSMIDLTKASITKSGNDIVFNFSNAFSAGDIHSFYVPNNMGGLYYCPYAKTISEVSSGCSNAVSFTDAEASVVTQKTISGGIAAGSWVNASIEGSYYKIMTNSTADDGGGGNPAPPVPEFSAITTILALAIVLSGFLFIRKNRTV